MKILESLLVLLFCDNITVYYGLDRLIDDTILGCLNRIVFVQYYVWVNIILHRYIEYRWDDIILRVNYRDENDFPLKLLSDFNFWNTAGMSILYFHTYAIEIEFWFYLVDFF